ncbi:Biogenesis of lysosome-related organelles complex 1 subunit 1 [Zea mays]|uniref:Biogenesis of lysosome-related organelles complex 1 subunit 1 n=1 Tax=Zea mays TaxID=4577 RepID=A0A3L6ED79_MAIZE|nr:Biogenesis of lysosome-related organelles complex 1 subunit 1 [Zea mays]
MVTIEEKIFDFMKSCSKNALLISYSGAHGERAKKHIVGSEDGDEALTYEVSDDAKDLKASNVPLEVRNFMGNKELSVEGKRTTAEGNVEIVPGDELTATLLDAVNTIQRTTTGYDQIRSTKKKEIGDIENWMKIMDFDCKSINAAIRNIHQS